MDRKSLNRIIWGILFLIYASGYLYYGDLVHFTWWSLLNFVLYSGLGIFGTEYTLFWFIFPIQLVVFLGVNVMSFSKCGLLRYTEADVGAGIYLFGNYMYHHVTLLWMLGLTDVPKERSVHRELLDIVSSWALFLTYMYYYDPSLVYDCPLPRWGIVCGITVFYGSLILIRAQLSR